MFFPPIRGLERTQTSFPTNQMSRTEGGFFAPYWTQYLWDFLLSLAKSANNTEYIFFFFFFEKTEPIEIVRGMLIGIQGNSTSCQTVSSQILPHQRHNLLTRALWVQGCKNDGMMGVVSTRDQWKYCASQPPLPGQCS